MSRGADKTPNLVSARAYGMGLCCRIFSKCIIAGHVGLPCTPRQGLTLPGPLRVQCMGRPLLWEDSHSHARPEQMAWSGRSAPACGLDQGCEAAWPLSIC